MERYADALDSYDRAIALMPGYPTAHYNRGAVLHAMRRCKEALEAYDRAIALRPNDAGMHYDRGIVLADMGRHGDALASYAKAVALKPDHASAHKNSGIILQEMKRYDEAFAAFSRALVLDPGMTNLKGVLTHLKMMLCEWKGIDAAWNELAEGIEEGRRMASPFELVATPLSASQQRKCAELYIKERFPPAATPLCNGERYAHDRIHVGYFSADFHRHATMDLMARVFELHDRSRFEVTAFSFGPPVYGPVRQRLLKACEHFIDVRDHSPLEIATHARQLDIDIAIDLKGFTHEARTDIFALRPAPVQVNYLGFPGTMGAPYIDYLIADATVIPDEHRRYYTEKIVYLPYSYQPNDSARPISDKPLTRAEMGLPDQGCVFCCLNNPFKISPAVYDVWMRLLHKVDSSVLWLLEGHPIAVENLRKEASLRGIPDHRIVFAKNAERPEHLARMRLADLFLDTFYCNAHTTASEALWAGLPVLTWLGETFAGRVAASVLKAVGLPELITHSHEEYEALAVDLATHPQRLLALRRKLANNRLTYPLFDTALYTRHLEQAYIAMADLHKAGARPEVIYIDG